MLYTRTALLFGLPEQVVTERKPILRWTEYWRPCELYVEDCVGRFDKEARARACRRAQAHPKCNHRDKHLQC